MTTLGLTGGIGSGKSAAAAMLESKPGVRVVYADAVARELMEDDAGVRAALVARFGPEVYRADGRLDRAALAAHVFERPDPGSGSASRTSGSGQALAALNAIVHPAVRGRMLEEIERARAGGVRLLVYEAALIYEAGADRHLDHVAVVDAPLETRLARVTARDGVGREAVLARMRSQLPSADLRRRADFVLENDDDLAHLQARVDRLYARLASEA